MKRLTVLHTTILLLLAAGPLHAGELSYAFTYSDTAGDTGHGTLTGTDVGDGSVWITSGTITLNTVLDFGLTTGTYSLLSAGPTPTVSPSGVFTVDNLVFPAGDATLGVSGPEAFVDNDGLLFGGMNREVALWGNGGGDYALIVASGNLIELEEVTGGSFTLTSVPEPPAAVLMLPALIGLAGWVVLKARRRRRPVRVAAPQARDKWQAPVRGFVVSWMRHAAWHVRRMTATLTRFSSIVHTQSRRIIMQLNLTTSVARVLLVAVATCGLAHQARGQSLYLIDALQNVGDRFDAQTGANQGVFLSGYDLVIPTSLAVGADGTVFVDDLADQVVKFNGSTGVYEGGAVPGGVTPQMIAVGPDGRLYGSDEYATATGTPPNITITDPFRGHVLAYDQATGDRLSDFRGPIGSQFVDLAFGPNNICYVSDFTAHQIDRFDTTTGTLLDPLPMTLTTSGQGLAVGPDGNVYVGDLTTDSIYRFDGTTGALIDTFATGDGFQPYFMTFGPNGNLYVGDSTSLNTLVFNSAGESQVFIEGVVGPMAFSPTPEPGTFALAGVATLGLIVMRVRRRRLPC